MKTTRILSMALVLIAAATVSAVAQPQPPRGGGEAKTPPTLEEMAQKRTEQMTKQLGLSEDQAKEIYTINLNAAEAQQALRQEQQALREKQQESQKAANVAMLGVLTPEQQAEYIAACKRAERGQRGQKGEGQGQKPRQGQKGKGAPEGCPEGRPEGCPPQGCPVAE